MSVESRNKEGQSDLQIPTATTGKKKERPMADEERTPWEQKEKLEEELRVRDLLSSSDAEWDHGNKNRIVNPMSTQYPPPYDPGSSVEPNVDGDSDE
jgi:hypothetical protein